MWKMKEDFNKVMFQEELVWLSNRLWSMLIDKICGPVQQFSVRCLAAVSDNWSSKSAFDYILWTKELIQQVMPAFLNTMDTLLLMNNKPKIFFYGTMSVIL